MTRDSDPLTTPCGQPAVKFNKNGISIQTTPNPRRRKTDRNRTGGRVLDAYEAMQARAAGRLYDDDDVSPFTSEDDE